MVTILDLPPEIRNMIWDLCLVSPTGVISPISRRDAYYSGFPGSCSHSGPFFYLQVEEDRFRTERPQTFHHVEPTSTVSLSLPRACRKIFKETNDRFWAKNTFYLPTPHRLIYTLKSMGKYPQGRITSLRLAITPWVGNDVEWFDKAMQLLISQGTSSSLQRLDILVHKETVMLMSNPKLRRFHSFLQKTFRCLQQARRLRGVERNLVVTHQGEVAATLSKESEDALFQIKEVWASKVYWGSTLLFEDVSRNGKETSDNGLVKGNHGLRDIEKGLLG